MVTLLAIGDCNTLGVEPLNGNGYVEQAAATLGMHPVNCGVTMSTTREGLRLLTDHWSPDVDLVTIQFGLVDSWRTFKYAPYVLYYPDNPIRKLSRKLVKKYKKLCRNYGLNQKLGEAPVVPPEEYTENLEHMVTMSAPVPVILIDTVPNQDVARNNAIQRYNARLKAVAGGFSNACHLPLYDDFLAGLDNLYHDSTHINAEGHAKIAARLEEIVGQQLSR